MLRSVRRVFDPDGLFNPGKVVPDLVTELSPFVPETPRSDTESSLGEGGA
jgi:hypothetical protein